MKPDFINKPILSTSKYKRRRQVKALFLKWVIDLELETPIIKDTAHVFIAFYGIASYTKHMKEINKEVRHEASPR